MRDLIEESIRLLQIDQPFVLATIVRTRGMTPQKAGAKQIFKLDGASLGTLGGGCLEGDIAYCANQILQNKSGPEFRVFHLNEAFAAQDGFVCGGTMEVFIEPLRDAKEALPLFQEKVRSFDKGPAIAVATVVKSADSSVPCGKKMLVRADGTTVGAVGDMRLQNQIVGSGKALAPYGHSQLIAGDDLTLFIEGYTTTPTLIILGGGHIGLAVYNLALTLGFSVIVIDDRAEFAAQERFPKAAKLMVEEYDTALAGLEVNFNSFILIATRGHRYDEQAVRAAVATNVRYIGLLGSKRKNSLIFSALQQSGIPLEKLKNIYAPVGLAIGALTPEELAVSILAEIIQNRRGGDGRSLKSFEMEVVRPLAGPICDNGSRAKTKGETKK